MRTNRILVLIGALMLIIGARLPWISVPVLFGVKGAAYEAIEIGWEDNGLVTGGIGLVLLLAGVLWKGRIRMRSSIPASLLAAFATIVVMGCFLSVLEINPSAGFVAATDIGIYVSLLGAVLALVGAVGAVFIGFSIGRSS